MDLNLRDSPGACVMSRTMSELRKHWLRVFIFRLLEALTPIEPFGMSDEVTKVTTTGNGRAPKGQVLRRLRANDEFC
jgi:hypothetical protein